MTTPHCWGTHKPWSLGAMGKTAIGTFNNYSKISIILIDKVIFVEVSNPQEVDQTNST
jgi:hypothetical protein